MSGKVMTEALAIELIHSVAQGMRAGCKDTCYTVGEMIAQESEDSWCVCALGAWYLGASEEDIATSFDELYAGEYDDDYEAQAVEIAYQLLGSIFQINFSQLRRLHLPVHRIGYPSSTIWDWITGINDDFMSDARREGAINIDQEDPRLLIAQALDTIADQKLFIIE